MKTTPNVEVICLPDWWFTHYGISFTEPFYLDYETRIKNDILMREILWERFGLGERNNEPRPVIGSMYVAGGFVMPAMFGVDILFSDNQSPTPIPVNLSREEVMSLNVPDWKKTWPMNLLIRDMNRLREEFGYVIGDFDTDGILNTALHLRGQQLFTDFYKNPELVEHLFSILTETYIQVASFLRAQTGSCSLATNRSILRVDPSLYLHSNCSVCMISPLMYAKYILPFERKLATALKPYGVHHCGGNTERYLDYYSQMPLSFLDVGWGSNVTACRKALPETFLNLRLNPERMRSCSANEVRGDIAGLLEQVGESRRFGLCCINMDTRTPDENVQVLLSAKKGLAEDGNQR